MQQLILELAPPPAPTFENFFPGANQAVLAALQSGGGGMPGPGAWFLWGPAASGKTHLLRASAAAYGGAGTAARGTGARRHAAYCPYPFAELSGLRDCGLLAVDDVERLDRVAQLALFDLFNIIIASGGSVVTAANRPPDDLPLREDLRTRLASGPGFQLRALGDAEKAAALLHHARARGMNLSEEMVAYLLARVARDLGTQFTLLDALDRLSLRLKRPVTMPLLREALRSLEGRGEG